MRKLGKVALWTLFFVLMPVVAMAQEHAAAGGGATWGYALGAGLAIGLASAFALSRLMASLLFETEPTDFATYAIVTLLLAATAIAVTLVPATVCFAVGRYVFKMNAALLLGALTGSMTSTAALQQVSGLARSAVPMLGYVGTYAFANVLLAFAGGLIMRL